MKNSKKQKYIDIISKSRYFNRGWYLDHNPSIALAHLDPVEHYLTKGWKEGCDPSPKFNTQAYLEKYPECRICPLIFDHNRNDPMDLAVCVIVKNEAPYIKEWLDYYRLLGVKRFYVYDNESDDNLKDVLEPYMAEGFVVYKFMPGSARQNFAYNECLKTYRTKTKWLAFIDVDEFIVPTKVNRITKFLKDYEQYPGVGINWICFDSNGHETKPSGGILENYTRVQWDDNYFKNYHVKSIVQPLQVYNFPNAHYANYLGDKLAVTENYEPIDGVATYAPHERAFTHTVSVNKIRINHYYCKSRAEAKAKVAKGVVTRANMKKQIPEKELNFEDYKYDYSVCRFVCKLHPKIAWRERRRYLKCKIKNIFISIKHRLHRQNPSNKKQEK